MTTEQAFASALRHYQAGQLAEAEALYRQVLAVQPGHAEALHHLGLIAHRVDRNDVAVELIRRSLQIKPDSLEANLNLGIALSNLGRSEEAIVAYRQALEIKPGCVEAHSNLGNALKEQGRLDEAIAEHRRALEIKPDSALVHNNLGNALSEQGRFDEALAAYRQALALLPDCAEAHYNVGTTLARQDRPDEAVAAYRRALQIKPDHLEAHLNLGNALKDQQRWEEATAAYRDALSLDPANPVIYGNLGAALSEQGRFDEAEETYRRAQELGPDYEGAKLNHGLLLLLRGDFARGWPLFEARWSPERHFPQPRWDGSALDGRRVLIHAERGFGDSIHFIRYARLVSARGGEVIVECPRSLVELFRGVEGVRAIVASGDPLPPFDVHLPMLSLPLIFKTTLENIPREVPYLFAEPGRCETWRERLGRDRSRLRVGLAWAGDPGHSRDRVRSLHWHHLLPLVGMESVDFYSVQKGRGPAEIQELPETARMIDYTGSLQDFADTAAFMTELDLIISVDTAVAHLAGALGRPVWALLPFVPEWRWGLESETTPWYPTMRLFRQPAVGDWEAVMARVQEELTRTAVKPAL